jgi:hypothetical protein|tara:strand:+ start:1388 stop:1651 length:264 start_codon:yes stop_codon:yes gene_type:complete
MNNFKMGDLVKFAVDADLMTEAASNDAIGVIVEVGEEDTRIYGDGICTENYVDVVWLTWKPIESRRYRAPQITLKIISKALDKQQKL